MHVRAVTHDDARSLAHIAVSCLATDALAIFAKDASFELDVYITSLEHRFQVDYDMANDVFAWLTFRCLATAVEVGEHVVAEVEVLLRPSTHVAVTVEFRPLGSIAEHFVGFCGFLERFFGFFVPRILVGMVLQSHLPISLLISSWDAPFSTPKIS